MKRSDLALYLVTDRDLSKGRKLEWIVEEAVRGGVTMVQLREKGCPTREFVELAIKIKEVLRPYNVPFIINDRIDVALACDADGVHIGQSDMPYPIARKILGRDKIIGLSIENIAQAREAEQYDVDYIAVSPVFSTETKSDTSTPFGIEGVREVASFTSHPMVGIGRMNSYTIGDVIRAGADGVAVVSAIVSADSPKKAAEELLKLV